MNTSGTAALPLERLRVLDGDGERQTLRVRRFHTQRGDADHDS